MEHLQITPSPAQMPLQPAHAPENCLVALQKMLTVVLCLSGLAAAAQTTTNDLAELKRQRADLKARSNWPKAAAIAAKVVESAVTIHGEAHPETTAAMYEQGYLMNCAGEHAAAEKLWWRAVAIQDRLFGTNSVEVAVTLRSLADVRQYAGDYLQARQILLRAVSSFEHHPGRNDRELGKALRSLGVGHASTDEWEKAESYYRRSLAVFERIQPESPPDVADLLTKLGELYLRLSDAQRAEPVLRRAIDLRLGQPGSDDVATANLMCSLAEVQQRAENFAEARALFENSLRILDGVLQPYENHKRFFPLLGLGNLLSDLGELDQAELILKRASSIAKLDQWTESWRTPIVLTALGLLKERKGNYPQARQFHEEAHRICLKSQGTDYPGAGATLRALARLDFAMGNQTQALAQADTILDGEERSLAEALSFTSEQQRLVFQRHNLGTSSLNLWATMGAVQPLARAVLRSKGIVLDSLLEERLVAEAGENAALREQVRELSSVRQRLAQLETTARHQAARSRESSRSTGDVLKLVTQIEALEASLARNIAGMGRARRALSVQTGDIEANLPADAALLEFVLYKHYLGKDKWQRRYGVLIFSAGREVRWVALDSAEAIDRNIKLCQHLVRERAGNEALARQLRVLHEQIWQPLQLSLPTAARQLIVSPDSQLNFLSFATLVTLDDRFLGESVSISYVSSGRDLLAMTQEQAVPRQLYVWANPDFGAVPAGRELASQTGAIPDAGLLRGFRDFDLRRLPGAEKEGRTLRDRAADFGFARTELRLGKEASEAALYRVQSPPVLHLATHGFIFPEDSGTTSSTNSALRSDSGRSSFSNPMLRSGLALAGARQTIDAWSRGRSVPAGNDGIVTAEEIGCLQLRGTRLVVLSACETGLGKARAGEGVLGLRRGFVQAGAQNLLLTLWPIDDERTAGFMPELYAEMNRTGDVAESLATVQRVWLKRLRLKKGIAEACRVAGPFILSFQGKPGESSTTAPKRTTASAESASTDPEHSAK